jgi:hypothetical protein
MWAIRTTLCIVQVGNVGSSPTATTRRESFDGHPKSSIFLIYVWMEVQTPTGLQTYLIEIKPKAQTEFRAVKRKTRKFLQEAAIVAVNHAKWDAAKAFCRERGWTFQVLTEDHLFGGVS